MTRKVGIINSGGDCAGINAVIASIVIAGAQRDYQFLGFERGWEGLLDNRYRELDPTRIHAIANLGGTILHTTNRGRFSAKVGTGDTHTIDPDVLRLAKHNLDANDVEGLIVIGGDGTLSGALQLAELGVPVIGVPKSIDNDLASTERTFGFSTAVQVAVDAIDKIQTTAYSHNRIFFVECMGRNAGWLALYAGVAAGANAILLPEVPCSLEGLLAFLRGRRDQHFDSTIVVVAEAFKVEGERVTRGHLTSSEVIYAGITDELIRRLGDMAPGEMEMRNVVLGHTQRGGPPNAEDRILSKRFGVAAVNAYDEGLYGSMVALRGTDIITTPIIEAVRQLKLVTPESVAFQTACQLGIFFGDHGDPPA